jgi:hypothetical protein
MVTGFMGAFWGFHVDVLKIPFAWDVASVGNRISTFRGHVMFFS